MQSANEPQQPWQTGPQPPSPPLPPAIDQPSFGPPGNGAGAYIPPSGPPQVRMDAISEAWRLMQQEIGVWIGASAIYLGVVSILMYGGMFALGMMGPMLTQTPGANPLDAFGPTFWLKYIVLVLCNSVVSAYLVGGLFHIAVKQVRGQKVSIGDMTSAGDATPALFISSIVMGLIIYGGMVLCFVPGLIFTGLLMFVFPLIVDRRMGPMAAIGQSWGALKGQVGPALGFVVVLFLIYMLGACACGVGVLIAVPLCIMSIAVVYRDFFIGAGTPQMPSVPGGIQPPIPEPGSSRF